MFVQTQYPHLEVSGHYLVGLDDVPLPTTVATLRRDYGLHCINHQAWYPADTVLSFYEAVGADEAGAFDLVTIGRRVAETLPYPSYIQTLHDALTIAPDLHRAAWRGGYPGELTVRRLGERHTQLVFCDLPLPVDLVYGLCYGMVERFVPRTDEINVQRIARGNRYIFDVRW